MKAVPHDEGATGLNLPAVVCLTSYDYPQYADAAMRLGASGFVVKTAPTSELLDAVRRAAAGGMAFGVRPVRGVVLSDRERQVVELIVAGASNDEIGGRLGISARTVESHLRRLFDLFVIGVVSLRTGERGIACS